jgi:dolichol-phosphate mannosyltransferase
MGTKRESASAASGISELGQPATPTLPADVTSSLPPASIIVPTYQEAENIPLLVALIEQLRTARNWTVELLIMDDYSGDDSEEVVARLAKDWVRLITRRGDRGLSRAVVDGLRLARFDVLVVMDADLSHPPETIPALIHELQAGADFVIGSRYVAGGSTAADWGFFRRWNSQVATWLAWPFTSARDPLAGFFALRRQVLDRGNGVLNPIGYKIGLELLVKCGCNDVREVPIHFSDRKLGRSKLSFREQLRYLQHLRRLFIYRYWTWSHLIQFLAVGLSGVIVNLLTLTLLIALGSPEQLAVATAIAVSLLSNFALNRRLTFSYARHGSIAKQFLGFVSACAVGAAINFATTLLVQGLLGSIQLAALFGIVAGTAFNFLSTRFLVFQLRDGHPEHHRTAGIKPVALRSTAVFPMSPWRRWWR